MLAILINHQPAFIRENTSFDFISENSMFTGSDSYTLNIAFPLKDCPQNREIFGLIERQDVEKEPVTFDCEIIDRNFYKAGTITITQVTEKEVKTQFLEGRSEQNFADDFDEVFINELQLGYATQRDSGSAAPSTLWGTYPAKNEVAMPWVNNTSGNIQNEVEYTNGQYAWARAQVITYQPFLLHILKTICAGIGYSYDFSELEASEFRYLIVCNTLPSTWNRNNYADALPHWSLTEFFEQLELFLFGEFNINHKARRISFRFNKTALAGLTPVLIENVINEYTTDVSLEDNKEYIALKNIRYAENDNRYWAYRDCEWYIREHKSEAVVYNTLAELLTFAETLKESGVYEGGSRTGLLYTRGYKSDSMGHKLFYARDVDQYFIMFCYDAVQVRTTTIRDEEYHWYKYYNRLEPVNEFGRWVYDKEAEDLEMGIVPAWIDETDTEHGKMLFLECGEMGSEATYDEEQPQNSSTGHRPGFGGARTGNPVDVDETDYNDGALAQAKTGKAIEKGETEKKEEYFDKIYVGYWDGTNRKPGKMPHPFTHFLETTNEFTAINYPYSLSINRVTDYYDRDAIVMIDGKKKYNFEWIAGHIPDVRTTFFIKGKRYICEKITASFTEKGMSKKLKGVFYRLKDG